jgi:hypothetical protein
MIFIFYVQKVFFSANFVDNMKSNSGNDRFSDCGYLFGNDN